jgi:hypothetical protein
MIPKIIHYCWLSGDPIPEDYRRCMDTWIRKCMEYFENTQFFEPALLPEILKLKKTERFEFVSPLILPEIMKNVLMESFPHTICVRARRKIKGF